jgi:hypothetical protein
MPTNAHKHPVEYGDRRPGDQRHRYPDQVRVPIQRPAFQHVGALTPEPLQNPQSAIGMTPVYP